LIGLVFQAIYSLSVPEWCMKGPFATEWHFHQALMNDTVHRTDKPEEAHFFYVPLYSSCLIIKNFGKFPEYQQLVGAALTYVSGTFPYWNASHGSNHIWTFSHDFGACLGWTDQTSSVFYHEMRHSIFLTHNGDRRLGCYTPQKDIVVPSYYSDSGIMEVADNISSSGEVRMTQQQRVEWGAALVAKKDIFGYFRGTLAWKHSHDLPKLGIRKGFDRQYSNGIRQKLARLFGRDSKFLIADGSDGNYLSEMQRSLFCLCPRGFAAWSRRLFDAIITNCIPVIIADDADQPFQQMLDYDAFSLRVAEADLQHLKSILMKIPSARIYELLDNLQNVAHLFTYNHPMRHDDATYNVLVQLAAKASFK
jgi:hypothetical protein